MKKSRIPQILLAVSALMFAACAAAQFMFGQPTLGALFALFTVVDVTVFVMIRSGRITW